MQGKAQNVLTGESLVLDCMQRMDGIATLTQRFVKEIDDLPTQILDTRKTTPNFRHFEKWAVRLGGGTNHRFGLFDAIMIKDNHIDYCGGIQEALTATHHYLEENELKLPIIIETRNKEEVKQVLEGPPVDRILLDNFSPDTLRDAIQLIGGQVATEASGNIRFKNVRRYAETGVDYISVGALTHSARVIDMSLLPTKL
jgi:nicotinate-nucleotide pyrophosphorylase (carboxylating)